MSPTHTRVNQSEITPTVRKACSGDWTSNDGCCGICAVHRNDHEPRKASTYCLVTYGDPYRPGSYCCDAYRNGKIIAYGNGAATLWAAIREARRNVRNARKAGGL